jgi:parallel beta-helix repeat protein
MPSKHNLTRILCGVASAAALALAAAAPASADVTCDRYASPTAGASGTGSLDAPYASVEKLSDSLSPGQTGCLRGGTFTEDVKVSQGGNAGAPVTLTSYPGERAKLVGRLWLAKGADYVTVANLDLNGKNDGHNPSPTVNADHARFVGNDVTNDHTDICFLLGNQWGSTAGTVIDSNRIHDCGVLPAANHDHGIYIEEATDTEIVGNLIYDNADRGVQLYPNAQRTHIAGNVIDGNGEGIIFSGAGSDTSNDTVVEDNIITNSNQRNNVESFYPDGTPIGQGNVVRNNCIAGGDRDRGEGGIAEKIGFKVEANNVLSRQPQYVNRAAKDYRLQADSPCAGIANAATKSSGTRVDVSAPQPTTTTPPANPVSTPQPGATKTRISLRMTRSASGRVHLKGRVQRHGSKTSVRSASAKKVKAVIQLRWDHAWYPIATAMVRSNRFSANLRIPAQMRGRVLKLRAVVPTVATSHSVRVRVR